MKFAKYMRSGGAGCGMLLVLAVLMGAGNGMARADDGAERGALLRKQQLLAQRISELEREREFLMFRRVLQQSDSKYLLLDLAAGTGTLKYRNRVLRSFRMTKAGGPKGLMRSGPVMLTEKRDKHGKNRMLLFGNALVLQGKTALQHQEAGRRYALGAKDLAAISYAVERGTWAYITH